MPTTPGGLPYPNSTDPVANGAQDIQDLAEAVDPGLGLWLVKSQTVGAGAGVPSVTVTNAFSADYENYKILYTSGTMSTTQSINLTLGATTSNYSNVLIYAAYSGGGVLTVPNSAGSSFTFAGYGSTNTVMFEAELYNPFLTRNTFMASNHMQFGGAVAGRNQGVLIDNTSYTSFTLTAAGGNLVGGTIRVYGYRR